MTRIPHPTAAIAIAATMRAAGEAWDVIAAKVRRSAERVRRWPRLYAREWAQHFQLAETHLLADAATEARQTLRQLMRSKAEKIQLAAAQSVLKARLHDRTRDPLPASAESNETPEDRQLKLFIEEMQSMTDEELESLDKEMQTMTDEELESLNANSEA